MEAQDTVMTNEQLYNTARWAGYRTEKYPLDVAKMQVAVETQAKISFEAGRQSLIDEGWKSPDEVDQLTAGATNRGLELGEKNIQKVRHEGRKEVVESLYKYHNDTRGWSTAAFAEIEKWQAKLKAWGLGGCQDCRG